MFFSFLQAVKKGVTKTLKEYIEATKNRHLAATKIQAAFRGFRVRKLWKMDSKIQLKSNNYVNIETVDDDFLTKYHPVRTDKLETGSTSSRLKEFRSSDPQQVDVLGKYSSSVLLLRSARMHCSFHKHALFSLH